MQAIKGLVVFMGLLLIAGTGLLGYGIYSKATKGSKTVVGEAPIVSQAELTGFGDIMLSEPVGSEIISTQIDGAVLVLQVRGGGRSDRVVLLDLTSGAIIGRVGLGSIPAAPAAQ